MRYENEDIPFKPLSETAVEVYRSGKQRDFISVNRKSTGYRVRVRNVVCPSKHGKAGRAID